MTERFLLFDVDALGPLNELTRALLSRLVASRPAGTTGILTSLPDCEIGSAIGPSAYAGRARLYPTRWAGFDERNAACYRQVMTTLGSHGFRECLVVVAPTAAVPGELGLPSHPVTTITELDEAIRRLLQPSPEPAEFALVAA